ncbi:hypothetical protein BDP67DRAFT_69569 [Colletotrichum lupini]|nr:hypothetical protein BDP67DRAFT_69569 [Colletotrichum lupini]
MDRGCKIHLFFFSFFVLGIHLGRGHWRFGEQKLCPIPEKGRTSKQLSSWEQEKKAGLKQAKLLDKQQEQRGMGGGSQTQGYCIVMPSY